MGIRNFFANLKKAQIVDAKTGESAWESDGEIVTAIREIAWESGIGIISKALSKCEFKTYIGGKEHKGKEYYLLNVKPNQNQNKAEFWQEVVRKLYENEDNDCLIFEINNQLYCADSFSRREYAFVDDLFYGITYKGLTLDAPIYARNAIYLKLAESGIYSAVNKTARTIEETFRRTVEGYEQKSSTHATMEIATQMGGFGNNKNPVKASEKAINNDYSSFFKKRNVIMPLYEGYKLNTIKTGTEIAASELKTLISLENECVSQAIGVPLPLMRGEVADTKDAVDNLLTFVVDPLGEIIGSEFTSKRYARDKVLDGCRMRVDSTNVKHIDIFGVSTAFDKLFSSAGFSVNELRGYLGQDRVEEPWADAHYITKNYESIIQENLRGGE